MPARVQSRPAEMVRSPSEKYNEHESANMNRNVQQHKEALRLALGSILTPKRPFTPSSRSSSGTASPAHPASFGVPGSPLGPPPPPHPTPTHSHADSHLLQARHIHQPHTPSRLGLADSNDSHWPPGSAVTSSASGSPASSQQHSPMHESPPPLHLPASVLSDEIPSIRAPKPVPAAHPEVVTPHPNAEGCPGTGTGTPKAKFLETLQSKSAWDALIHGSFS